MKSVLGFLVATLALFGCGQRSVQDAESATRSDPFKPFVGKWADKPKDARIALEIAADRSFQATFLIKSTPTVIAGKADLQQNKLVLVPTKFNGREPSSPTEQMKESFVFDQASMSLRPEAGPQLFKR
jgi:hypothetical protein